MPFFRPLPLMTAASVAALAVLIALGTWQMQRRAEKHEFLGALADKAKSEPVSLEVALTSADPRYVRVRIEAPANCESQALVNAFQIDGGKTVPGGDVVTPVKMANGAWLMVARGFVPDDVLKEMGGHIENAPCPSSVSGTAVLTPSSEGSYFTPKPDRAARRWFAYDALDIGKANGLSPVVPWVARLEPEPELEEGVYPRPQAYAADIPDNHLTYAMTWYGLALTLIGVYVAFHISAGRLGYKS
jgi:surfeit locus 1 family protein